MGDLVMFLRGRVATSDGTKLPHDALVERVCNNNVRQQIYTSPDGSFSMQLGSRNNATLDASADGNMRYGGLSGSMPSEMGIPRTDLSNCEVRASLSGFRSDVVTLVARDTFAGTIDVGSIVVERIGKIEGLTISATPYKAPKDARKAYEKGLAAKKARNLGAARESFEKAVEIYPKFANAWFELGGVLEKQNQTAAARNAYVQASAADTKFLPPCLALSNLAFQEQDWNELLQLTNHILELDPLNYARVKGYILDLDSFDYAEAYFYHAVANFNLDRIEAAEKSARKAANLDVRPRFPQIHLLLAEIYARKKDAPSAITEFKIYLDQAPNAANAAQVRERLLSLQASSAGPLSPPDQN
jgi:tetratricopeptide (TPR) repeat protein